MGTRNEREIYLYNKYIYKYNYRIRYRGMSQNDKKVTLLVDRIL